MKTQTKPTFRVEKEEYTGGGGRRGDELAAALQDLQVGHSVTFPADYVGKDPHWVQVKVSVLKKKLERQFRCKTQPNGDLKVYHVAKDA